MFYRRKILLALLQIFDNRLDKICLQKLLFLFSQQKQNPEYDFVPYKFGCYSYSLNADLVAMKHKGLVQETETDFEKTNCTDYITQLNQTDVELLQKIKSEFGTLHKEDLIRYTYLNYPFYAIRSEIAHKILKKNELDIISKVKPKSESTILFTIGYEGLSLEAYLVKLLKNDVKLLIDVRNNPLSMKYGFSKSTLKKCCENTGIIYEHIPEVGIRSEYRKELRTQEDYDILFANYQDTILTQTTTQQMQIVSLLKKYKRIALTCFEANICQCHRKPLSDAVRKIADFDFEIKHI